jgi:hypothetical protein
VAVSRNSSAAPLIPRSRSRRKPRLRLRCTANKPARLAQLDDGNDHAILVQGDEGSAQAFGWSIAALHRKNAATKLPFRAVRPIASLGRRPRGAPFVASLARLPARDKGAGADASVRLGFVIIMPLWSKSIGCSARGAQQMRFEALLEGPA